MKTQLKVLFLAAEADPFIKVGGLGDVAGSLPAALKASGGVDIRLVIPLHGRINRSKFALKRVDVFEIPRDSVLVEVQVFHTEFNDLPVTFIGGSLINPDAPVYSPDTLADGNKFTFFSLAALEYFRRINWQPHILHANDWHTAPAVYALYLRRSDFYSKTATVLGLHNLPYLGVGAGPALKAFNLPPASESQLPWWAQDFPLPLGLLAADHIMAVSPTYAREILTPDFGSGLESFLASRVDSISGILNGINPHSWDPQTDDNLSQNFSVENFTERTKNKDWLVQEFNLDPDATIPLLAFIGRMDPQKGIDLIPDALQAVSDLPWQIIFLGTGTPLMEDIARKIESDFPHRARAVIRFDAPLSRKIYGGSDMLLIPSRYEPCGLAQMIAMRYGCVPVARSTGGLQDTIQDNTLSQPGTGFLFSSATPENLAGALQRAINAFSIPASWRLIIKKGMEQDFSWERFALQYKDSYQKIYEKKFGVYLYI